MRAEDFIAPNGRLWSDIRKKKKRKPSAKRKRTQKMDRELAKRKRELWDDAYAPGEFDSYPMCGLCNTRIYQFDDCDPDHKQSRGMGGGKRDDSPENLHLVHTLGNRAKASMSLEAYLAKYSLAERQAICRGEPCPKRERPA